MQSFTEQFKQLDFVIRNAKSVLLFAHTRPDPDTAGANLAFEEYLIAQGKETLIASFDAFPAFAKTFIEGTFHHPDTVDIKKYDVVIASDSVNRGFEKVSPKLREDQVIILFDHHPDIENAGDIIVLDTERSSTCELIYEYLVHAKANINVRMATALLMGIIGDTGNFQHSNTSPQVLAIASELMRHGAPLKKIAEAIYTNRKVSTLKLWGRALLKAKINQENGMIYSALTEKDLEECGEATNEDIKQIATIMTAVPDTKFALIFFPIGKNTVKGSLRSEPDRGIDVSAIAHQLGGGGHTLASAFEMKGRIVENEHGWQIV